MIWLKNIIAYRLDATELTAEAIHAALAAKPFMAPSASDWYSQGWIPPASHQPDVFAIEAQGALLVTLRADEKIIPPAVVRQQADERVKQIEADEGRKVGRKELRDIRDAVFAELLPRALVKSSTQRALIDLQKGFVFVEAGSESQAEALLSVLRNTLGSLPTRLLNTTISPQVALTTWLEHGAPEGFTLDCDAELKFPGDGGAVAKLNRQSLEADEVKKHLQAGKLVTKLGLSFHERVSFILTDRLHFKRLAMLDVLQEEIESAVAADQAALFDATLTLCVGELRGLVAGVLEVLGGEAA